MPRKLKVNLTAYDQDGDYLTYAYVQPSHGTVTGAGPSLLYTPTTDFECKCKCHSLLTLSIGDVSR